MNRETYENCETEIAVITMQSLKDLTPAVGEKE